MRSNDKKRCSHRKDTLSASLGTSLMSTKFFTRPFESMRRDRDCRPHLIRLANPISSRLRNGPWQLPTGAPPTQPHRNPAKRPCPTTSRIPPSPVSLPSSNATQYKDCCLINRGSPPQTKERNSLFCAPPPPPLPLLSPVCSLRHHETQNVVL